MNINEEYMARDERARERDKQTIKHFRETLEKIMYTIHGNDFPAPAALKHCRNLARRALEQELVR